MKRTKKIHKLIAKSAEAISMFDTVIDELTQANEQLSAARAEEVEEKRRIEANLEEIYEQEKANNHIIVRIKNIIGGQYDYI